MRRAIIAVLALIGVMTAEAKEPVRIGVKAQWELTTPSTSLNAIDDGSGVGAGVLVNVPLWRGLYVEPGVDFYYNTMDINFIDLEINGHAAPGGYISNPGLRIPLSVGYKFPVAEGMSFSVFTGVNFNSGLGMKAHLNYDGQVLAGKKSRVDLYDGYFKKLDAQVKIGVRFSYLDNFFADISGGIGLNNICKMKMLQGDHLRRNTFSIGVGYMF